MRFVFSQIMLSISFPFAMGGALLISLYWHEMLTRSGKPMALFLKKAKWPFFGWCIFMIAFELATSISRGFYQVFTPLVLINGIIYMLVSLSVLIFFIVTRIKLQALFNNINKQLQTKREERLTIATARIQAMSVTLGLYVIFFILFGATNVLWYPVSYPIMWGLFYLNIQAMCLCQVLLIKAPGRSPRQIFRAIVYGDYTIDDSSLSMRTTMIKTGGE
jgi:hypothetical protein